MEKDTKTNHPEGCRCKGCVGYACSHNGLCGWAGCGRSFSWLRLVIAVLIGLFIFSAGIELGEMKAMAYMGEGHMIGRHWNNDMDGSMMGNGGTTTIVVPAPATPSNTSGQATPATTTPTVPAR